MSKSKLFLTTLTLSVAILISAFLASCTSQPVEVNNASEARDVVLSYLDDRYTDSVPANDLTWQEYVTTPDGLIGVETREFVSGEWEVTVSYPLVLPENTVYDVIVFNTEVGWHWKGTVKGDGTITELSAFKQMGKQESQRITLDFVKHSPTFAFDGIEESLKSTESIEISIPYTWTFVVHFESTHAGYGDRTGRVLAEAITPHVASVTVEQGEIKYASMDDKWDMMKQEELFSGIDQGSVIVNEDADLVGWIVEIEHLQMADIRGRILVEAQADKTSDKYWITLKNETLIYGQLGTNLEQIPFDALETEQQAQIWFSGPVKESYPAQVDAKQIVIVKDGLSIVIDVEEVVRGLDTPWAIDFAPDGRMFITERPGRVRIVKNGQLLDEPWITIDAAPGGESGLLGLALDPKFQQNGLVYLAYTYIDAEGNSKNRLVRMRDDPSSDKGILDRILVDGVKGASNHDGGRLRFGPDNKLYWTMGDVRDPHSAQDISSLNGKILRLNPDGTVPKDNPFPNSIVYSYGHRNPQGLAWQPGTGRLYSTEHGPSSPPPNSGQDEVNFIEAGNNYGWPIIHGDETREDMVSPVVQSGISETWAPAGATFVVGGPWDGSLLFVGLRGQTLYRLTLDADDPFKVLSFERLLIGEYGRLRDVVQGPDNAIYILTSNRDGRGQPSEGDDKVLRLIIR